MKRYKMVSCGNCDGCAMHGPQDCYNMYEVEVQPKKRAKSNSDKGWQREQAMEAGMGLGVEAYNDAMGY
jgi:Na+-translocating ferredoxin:NAD+ oxidoreductase RNF subunit RnfB